MEGGSPKCRRRNWVKTKKLRNYAVGEDLAWDGVLQMAKCTLVGRALGRQFAKQTVHEWARVSWGEQLGYCPVVEMLNRGWFAINLTKEEDLCWIQSKSWHINHTPVLLKSWNPMFDASKERVDEIFIWVRMPALPLHFWDFFHFRRIGYILGTFLEADLSFLETHEKKVAHILVNIDIREGLAESINMDWGPEIIPQTLDYENVPFRCKRCHAYGHPALDFPLPKHAHFGFRRKGAAVLGKGQPEKKDESYGLAQNVVEEHASIPVFEEPIIVSSGRAE